MPCVGAPIDERKGIRRQATICGDQVVWTGGSAHSFTLSHEPRCAHVNLHRREVWLLGGATQVADQLLGGVGAWSTGDAAARRGARA